MDNKNYTSIYILESLIHTSPLICWPDIKYNVGGGLQFYGWYALTSTNRNCFYS